jgi:transcriptional regulator with XRE-family HTH domain
VANADIRIRLGRAVKHLRVGTGVTQEELSARCGLHPTYISDIERGARNPSFEALVRLLEGLGLGLADLGVAYDSGAGRHTG